MNRDELSNVVLDLARKFVYEARCQGLTGNQSAAGQKLEAVNMILDHFGMEPFDDEDDPRFVGCGPMVKEGAE